MGPGKKAELRMRRITLEYLQDRIERVRDVAAASVPIGDPSEDPDPDLTLRQAWDIDVGPGLTGFRATVTFDTPYAKRQELNRRLKHPRGGKAGYLGDALKAEIPTFSAGLAARLKARNR